eukprot:6449998-Prymnesium_polylepis.1
MWGGRGGAPGGGESVRCGVCQRAAAVVTVVGDVRPHRGVDVFEFDVCVDGITRCRSVHLSSYGFTVHTCHTWPQLLREKNCVWLSAVFFRTTRGPQLKVAVGGRDPKWAGRVSREVSSFNPRRTRGATPRTKALRVGTR